MKLALYINEKGGIRESVRTLIDGYQISFVDRLTDFDMQV